MSHSNFQVCPPKSSAEDLSAELRAARDEVEELKHGLAQAKLSTDISQHEVSYLFAYLLFCKLFVTMMGNACFTFLVIKVAYFPRFRSLLKHLVSSGLVGNYI